MKLIQLKKILPLLMVLAGCLMICALSCAETNSRYIVTNPANAETEAKFSVFLSDAKALLASYSSETLAEAEADAVIAALYSKGYDVVVEFADDETIYRYDFASDLCVSLFGDRIANWSVQCKAEFDQAMVELGELEYCFNLIPGENEISEDEAGRLAMAHIEAYYEQPEEATITLNYMAQEENHQAGQWALGIETKNTSYSVYITSGKVTSCRTHERLDGGLEAYYVSLWSERGDFASWTLEEKVAFAEELPELLAQAEENEEVVHSDLELHVIASYGFCMPTDDAIPQEDAYEIALKATAEKFGVAEENLQAGEDHYSFFVNEENGAVWRVIFWMVNDENYHSGVVDLNAETGEVLRVEKNGSTAAEQIPYADQF